MFRYYLQNDMVVLVPSSNAITHGAVYYKKKHKYIYKKKVNGKWRYYYKNDGADESKYGTYKDLAGNTLEYIKPVDKKKQLSVEYPGEHIVSVIDNVDGTQNDHIAVQYTKTNEPKTNDKKYKKSKNKIINKINKYLYDRGQTKIKDLETKITAGKQYTWSIFKNTYTKSLS